MYLHVEVKDTRHEEIHKHTREQKSNDTKAKQEENT